MILDEHVVEIPNCVFPSLEGQQQKLMLENGGDEGKIVLTETDEFGQPLDLREKNTWR